MNTTFLQTLTTAALVLGAGAATANPGAAAYLLQQQQQQRQQQLQQHASESASQGGYKASGFFVARTVVRDDMFKAMQSASAESHGVRYLSNESVVILPTRENPSVQGCHTVREGYLLRCEGSGAALQSMDDFVQQFTGLPGTRYSGMGYNTYSKVVVVYYVLP